MMKRSIKRAAIIAAATLTGCFGLNGFAAPAPLAQAGSAVAEPVLLINPGFNSITITEVFGEVYKTIDGWVLIGDNTTVQNTADVPIKETSDSEDNMAVLPAQGNKIRTADPISLNKNFIYTAGFSVYCAGNAAVNVTVYDAKDDETILADKEYQVGGAEWNSVSAEYKALESTEVRIKLEVLSASETVYADDAFLTETSPLALQAGAYLRVAGDSQGIRFKGRIDKGVCDNLRNSDALSKADGDAENDLNFEFGIMLAPLDYVITAGEFTVEAFKTADLNYLLIKADILNNEETADADGFYGFNCAIVDIKESNLQRKFASRAYLKYSCKDGLVVTDCYVYSDFSEQENARSVYELAQKAAEYREFTA